MKLNALTVDLENWYDSKLISPHVAASYRDNRIMSSARLVLDLLDEHGITATFFVLGRVADEHPGLIKEISLQGHEIASHGWGHRLIYHQTEQEFEEDLNRGVSSLKQITGKAIKGFRAPS